MYIKYSVMSAGGVLLLVIPLRYQTSAVWIKLKFPKWCKFKSYEI